jgi:hypothetical protein
VLERLAGNLTLLMGNYVKFHKPWGGLRNGGELLWSGLWSGHCAGCG